MEIRVYNKKGKLEVEKEIQKSDQDGHFELVVKEENIEVVIKNGKSEYKKLSKNSDNE